MEQKTKLQAQFEEFHSLNPQVWKLFIRFAVQMIRAGHTTLSTSLIGERIRWETYVVTRDPNSVFKINNNYKAYYARMFMARFPSLPKFRTRELRNV